MSLEAVGWFFLIVVALALGGILLWHVVARVIVRLLGTGDD